jgi:hypothetical protein
VQAASPVQAEQNGEHFLQVEVTPSKKVAGSQEPLVQVPLLKV